MATIETDYRTSGGLGQTGRPRFSVTAGLAWLERHFEKRRSRRALLELSDDQLTDIGRSRLEAYREAGAWS